MNFLGRLWRWWFGSLFSCWWCGEEGKRPWDDATTCRKCGAVFLPPVTPEATDGRAAHWSLLDENGKEISRNYGDGCDGRRNDL